VPYPLKYKGFIFLPKQEKTQFWTCYWGCFKSKKRRKSKASYWALLIANREYVINPNASIAQVQIEIRPHRQAPLGVATEDGGSVTDQAHSANRQLE
jgi:hypothetical protein